mgnify:CR=1 FL=1
MKFLRHLLRITRLDRERNETIREKLGIENIVSEIKHYQNQWINHVKRMSNTRIPKQAFLYQPTGRRNIGRPKK